MHTRRRSCPELGLSSPLLLIETWKCIYIHITVVVAVEVEFSTKSWTRIIYIRIYMAVAVAEEVGFSTKSWTRIN